MAELQQGGKFIVYQYCYSILVMTFKRASDVYYIGPGKSAFLKGLRFTLFSLCFGWWGFPWGVIWTISTITKNCLGGIDVTAIAVANMERSAA